MFGGTLTLITYYNKDYGCQPNIILNATPEFYFVVIVMLGLIIRSASEKACLIIFQACPILRLKF